MNTVSTLPIASARGLARVAALSPVLFALACGGNYSNDDLEFQSAAPASEDLALTLAPPLRPNSAEAFRDTYNMVRNLNGTLDKVLALIEEVRRYAPTRRSGDSRTWGPFNDDKRRLLEHQVVITRVPLPVNATSEVSHRFDYQMQTRRKLREGAPWVTVISGSFAPTAGGLRWGDGRVLFTTVPLRQAGLEVEDQNLVSVEIEYQRKRWVELNAEIVAFPEVATGQPPPAQPVSARFHFIENPDTDRAMFTFMWRGQDANVTAAVMTSIWRLSDYAGRADLVVTEGAAMGASATDCWGPDTLLVYRQRGWDLQAMIGTPQACLVAGAVTRPQL